MLKAMLQAFNSCFLVWSEAKMLGTLFGNQIFVTGIFFSHHLAPGPPEKVVFSPWFRHGDVVDFGYEIHILRVSALRPSFVALLFFIFEQNWLCSTLSSLRFTK